MHTFLSIKTLNQSIFTIKDVSPICYTKVKIIFQTHKHFNKKITQNHNHLSNYSKPLHKIPIPNQSAPPLKKNNNNTQQKRESILSNKLSRYKTKKPRRTKSSRFLKNGGDLLSHDATQYHRREWA